MPWKILSRKEAEEIRYRYQQSGGEKGIVTRMGHEYGVDPSTISKVIHNKAWVCQEKSVSEWLQEWRR